MRTLDSLITQAIAGNDIWPVRLIDIEIGDTTYNISDHYRPLTVSTTTYLPNGDLLGIDDVFNSTAANHDSIEVSLSAVDAALRADVIAADTIGGDVRIYRGLVSPTSGDLIAAPILTYEGVIFSVSLAEDNPTQPADTVEFTTFTVSADIRATTFRLDETPGRFTNDESNRKVDITDTSMQYVAGLNGRNVRFGGPA